MGVPMFLEWFCERYPCLRELISEYEIPDFDNFYLDMNGIIHACSPSGNDNIHFNETEEEIFAEICQYVDFLFKMVKPKKVFFVAVDGVAPRAKMNEQRRRRFRAAKAAEERLDAQGQCLQSSAKFETNCISPGTEFMARLHNILNEFIIHKLSSDKLWKNARVFLSGHGTPGEGEHKIMDFIRYEKSQPGYNPNTRHCLYSLNADLILLSLCSHELYFSLIKEEARFSGRKTRRCIISPEETRFHLLHISLLRDYLCHEFSPVKGTIPFPFNIENIVDDFVLMSFLVGNDFIPPLRQLRINRDAFPVLFKTYMDVLPRLDGYINEHGTLNLSRFEAFLQKLSEYDFQELGELNDDVHYQHNSIIMGNVEKNDRDDKSLRTSDMLPGFSSLAVSKSAEIPLHSNVGGANVKDDSNFHNLNTNYYLQKFGCEKVTDEFLKDQAEGYVKAIQWNLHYYYNGVISWSWYYPHRFPPCLSDIKGFKHLKIDFELGKPFLPFHHLLAVLPKRSKGLLPQPYQKLRDANSFLDVFPNDFETDLNENPQSEPFAFIPVINEKLLMKLAEAADQELKEDEKKKNSHQPNLLYTYDAELVGGRLSFLPQYYPQLGNTHCKVRTMDPDFFRLPAHRIVKSLARGAVLDRIILGFPTLRFIDHSAEMTNVAVSKIVSKNGRMILTIKEHNETNLQNVKIVGKIVYVGWPLLREALVVKVSDGKDQIMLDERRNLIISKNMTPCEMDIYNKQIKEVKEDNYQRLGIFVENVNILVYAKCLSGIKMVLSKEGGLTERKQWQKSPQVFTLQTTVSKINIFHPDSHNIDIFPFGSTIFILTHLYYGSMGTIISYEKNSKNSLLVNVQIANESDFRPIYQNRSRFDSEKYAPNYDVAQRLGIEPNFVSRLTGKILVNISSKESDKPNRENIGLDLKLSSKNQETVGFTKKPKSTWLYSKKTVKLLNAYLSEFPDFFVRLFKFLEGKEIYLEDLYPNGEGYEVINKITTWLKSQESAFAARQKCSPNRLCPEVVQEIEKVVADNKYSHRDKRKSYLAHEVFSPFMCKGIVIPDPTTSFHLFDRVVNVSQSTCVPFGFKGTVIGITSEENESVMCEIIFDKEFFGGLTLSCLTERGYRLSAHCLINISHGLRAKTEYQRQR